MKKFTQSWLAQVFLGLLGFTLVIYILRGLAVLSMMPGGVIWFLFLVTIAAGILAALQTIRKRY